LPKVILYKLLTVNIAVKTMLSVALISGAIPIKYYKIRVIIGKLNIRLKPEDNY
jgi:general stress protein CsbA